MPTLRQLEYLVALADLQHFGRAAAAAHTSQPTLSHQLRALEKKLGVTLVERSSGGMAMTPLGREMAARARKVLLAVRDMRELASRAAEKLAGTLHFGASPTLGPYLMPPIIAELHREYPDLRLYIREGIPDDQVRDLSRGTLDMLLGPLPMDAPDLQVEPLFRERMLLVSAADHPLTRREALRKADLRGIEMLSLDRRHHFHRQVAALCREIGAELLHDYEGTSLDSLRQMAASGLGLAMLPELYLRSEAGGMTGIVVLDVVDLHATRSIAAGWRKGAALAASYRRIAEHIRARAGSLLDEGRSRL
ncbi:LysR substrate-binding domain-containing protein [Desertibaculum subflavum]|uniref:LysR substrate-binding domain-containing protein n=1 Tax=Desertibaculum subflavum TaxID=2268458 RepID=UPI000E666B60